jgi:antitoxin (DNA-binding transcriptional repressor) of toxin-antitoxin stability system
MRKTLITVTAASRNFADCVNRVLYQDATFVLLKNGKPVARICPEKEKACTGRDLAKAIEKSRLSVSQAKAWNRDLRKARKLVKPPTDKWR